MSEKNHLRLDRESAAIADEAYAMMYPVAEFHQRTGKPCEIEGCACEGKNEAILVTSIDPALN
jgi:hypothetical protein